MKTIMIATGAAAALLAGCATPPAAHGPIEAAPAGPDTCGAAGFQWLVGRPIGDVPSQPPGRTWLVYSTDHVITMDYSPQRMNVEYGHETQRILRVWCG